MSKTEKTRSASQAKRAATGDEIMKRPPPDDLSLRPWRFEFDPKKAYSLDQLAEMGAIALKWNQIEAHIDFIASQILFAKVPMWLHLSVDRTLRFTTKLALLGECVEKAVILSDVAKKAIAGTFTDLKSYNAYRNAVIHHSIYDHEKGIGSYIDESKKPFEILVSLEAHRNLYNLMDALLAEVREVDLLFRIETDAQRPGRSDPKTREFIPFSIDQLKSEVVPHHVSALWKYQANRKALPKLPKFPDADLICMKPESTQKSDK